jgi:uncharacterized membrane protein HdeD (DUF308 family)
MTSASGMTDSTESMLHELADHWGLVVAMGVASVVIGIMAIVWPGKTVVVVAIFFAAWLFVSGIVAVIQTFTSSGDAGARFLHGLIGLLSIIVGFALLRTPFQSVEVMIYALGIFWVIQGVIGFIGAFQTKQGRGWRLFMAIVGVIAGIIILVYPMSSAVTLAFFGGIWLIILGVMQLVAGWQLRSASKAGAPAGGAATAV